MSEDRSEERGMMVSNNTAKSKTIKDLDLNDSSMNVIKVASTPHFSINSDHLHFQMLALIAQKAGLCTKLICLSLTELESGLYLLELYLRKPQE
jgi:hypothetical protein